MTQKRRNHEIETLEFKKQYGGKVAELAEEVFNYLDNLDTRFGLDMDYLDEYEEFIVFEYAFQAQKYENTSYLDKYFKEFIVRRHGAIGELMWYSVFEPCVRKMSKDLYKILRKYDKGTIYTYLD